MGRRTVEIRFYAELRDFVASPDGRVVRSFELSPSVKDLIESCGVPHTEVDLILVDGESVDFSHRLTGGERISVYPVFESFDISPLVRLRPRPLREPRFVADVHLGRLARYLRLLGFDTRYDPRADDAELVRRSVDEWRLLLTRDVQLLKHGELTHGYFVRATEPRAQLLEVVSRFHLQSAIRPFGRCAVCNSTIEAVEKAAVEHLLPDAVRRDQDEIWRCSDCGRLYWKGSHVTRIAELAEAARRA
ncbi:MAG: Mut7-C RNAse domain-containing protein [Actinomycetes bacterium]